MAFQNRDYSFQGQVPMASIMQAYQNKARQEFEAKRANEQAQRQKHQDVLQTINMASQLVQQGVQMSTARQQREARQALASEMAKHATESKFGPTPGYEAKMKGLAQQAFPDLSSRKMIDDLYKDKPDPLDQKIKQEKYAKLVRDRKAPQTDGPTLDSPSKIKASILNRMISGQEVNPTEKRLVASDLQDPSEKIAIQVLASNPLWMTKSDDEKVQAIQTTTDTIREWREQGPAQSLIVMDSKGGTHVIKANNLGKARKIDPKLKIIGRK